MQISQKTLPQEAFNLFQGFLQIGPELGDEKWCIQGWRFHVSLGRNLTAQGGPPGRVGTDAGSLRAAH